VTKTIRVGSFQFAAGRDIARNVAAIERGIALASRAGVRLLLTQECGLCGYPPVERDGVASLDQGAQRAAFEFVARLAQRHDLFVVVGMITAYGARSRNSICLIGPDGTARQTYHKRALWGWDVGTFEQGDAAGICDVDGIRVGLRICYEVRFPEYFRELFVEKVDLALVALSNVGDAAKQGRTEVYRAHLVSRASENAMWVLSANSTSQAQFAPSCLVDPDGDVKAECRADQEDLLAQTIEIGEPGFAREGRIALSKALTARESGIKASS